jgi:release factor glutamine methyltransferase
MTIAQALREAMAQGLERLDAQLLMLHTLGRSELDRSWLLAHDTDVLAPEQHMAFQQWMQRRLSGEPVAYLTGFKEFYGLRLRVTPDVLVPRPDTETLVDWVLEIVRDQPQAQALARIADLGTGSGAIALALQSVRPDLKVSAVERSAQALAIAQANAQTLDLPVEFLHGSWTELLQGQYAVIASNPPYIASADHHLQALVHEPMAALTSGADGLDDIRHLVQHCPAHLNTGGWLVLEHGYDQADVVCALLNARGFESVQSRQDLAGIARCSGGRWPG